MVSSLVTSSQFHVRVKTQLFKIKKLFNIKKKVQNNFACFFDVIHFKKFA